MFTHVLSIDEYCKLTEEETELYRTWMEGYTCGRISLLREQCNDTIARRDALDYMERVQKDW